MGVAGLPRKNQTPQAENPMFGKVQIWPTFVWTMVDHNAIGSESVDRSFFISQPQVGDPDFSTFDLLLNGEYISRHELVPDVFCVNLQVYKCCWRFFVVLVTCEWCSSSPAICVLVAELLASSARGSVEQWPLLETDLPSCHTCARDRQGTWDTLV